MWRVNTPKLNAKMLMVIRDINSVVKNQEEKIPKKVEASTTKVLTVPTIRTLLERVIMILISPLNSFNTILKFKWKRLTLNNNIKRVPKEEISLMKKNLFLLPSDNKCQLISNNSITWTYSTVQLVDLLKTNITLLRIIKNMIPRLTIILTTMSEVLPTNSLNLMKKLMILAPSTLLMKRLNLNTMLKKCLKAPFVTAISKYLLNLLMFLRVKSWELFPMNNNLHWQLSHKLFLLLMLIIALL